MQDFVGAGANIITTNTYQCNLEEFGHDDDAFKDFINKAVEVAKSSGAEIIAGSIGPYAAKFKNGTSYTGIYNDIPNGIDEKDFLKKWHLPRIQCMIKNDVDILAFETCPKLIEGVVFSELIQELQYPGFICFQCRNENETAFGEKIEEVLDALVASPYLIGVGINCVSLKYASKLMDKFVAFQKDYQLKNPDFKLEIIAYPNSGEVYNGQDMEWIIDPDCKGNFIEHSEEFVKRGATIIGGCCRVFASDIRKLVECVKTKNGVSKKPNQKSNFLPNRNRTETEI